MTIINPSIRISTRSVQVRYNPQKCDRGAMTNRSHLFCGFSVVFLWSFSVGNSIPENHMFFSGKWTIQHYGTRLLTNCQQIY